MTSDIIDITDKKQTFHKNSINIFLLIGKKCIAHYLSIVCVK